MDSEGRSQRSPDGQEFDLSNPVESFAATVKEGFLESEEFFARIATNVSLNNPLICALTCVYRCCDLRPDA